MVFFRSNLLGDSLQREAGPKPCVQFCPTVRVQAGIATPFTLAPLNRFLSEFRAKVLPQKGIQKS